MAETKKAAVKKPVKAAPKKAAAKKAAPAAASKKVHKGSTAAYNKPSAKKAQMYGGNQAIPLEHRENGGKIG